MIGEGRAASIIRYRGFLHGFISKEQLKEVRNLPDSVLQQILPHVEIDISRIKPVNINTSDPLALRHPYLTKAMCEMIVNYRLQHGDYKTIEVLKDLPLFNDELYRKIAPYLTVNSN